MPRVSATVYIFMATCKQYRYPMMTFTKSIIVQAIVCLWPQIKKDEKWQGFKNVGALKIRMDEIV